MIDYSKMSDFEINAAVSMAMLTRAKNPSSKHVVVNDYCNNPADAWPIIVENRIRINPILYTKWMAEDYLEDVSSCDENPLRAAMIVFLMMQEEKK